MVYVMKRLYVSKPHTSAVERTEWNPELLHWKKGLVSYEPEPYNDHQHGTDASRYNDVE